MSENDFVPNNLSVPEQPDRNTSYQGEENQTTYLSEKELTENTNFIQHIIDKSPALILVTDVLANNRLIYINKTTEDVLGYSRNAVPNFKRINYVHPQDRVNWIGFYKCASELPDDGVCESEYRVKSKHGDYIWLHNKSTVFKRNENGEVALVLSICTDITAKKIAEEQLKENLKFTEHITNAVPDILCVFDLINNTVNYLNRIPYELLGYSKEETEQLAGDNYFSIIHPDDHTKTREFLGKFFTASDDDILILENRIKSKTGDWHYFKAKAKVLKRDEEGRVTHFVSVVQDVTEQMELHTQILEKNTFIETLIDANVDRIMAYDRNMNVVAWNKKCEDIYEIKKEEIIGKPFFNFFPALKDQTVINNALKKSMNGETVKIPVHKNLYTSEFTEIFYAPLKDAENNVTGVVTIIRDLNERIKTENELLQLNVLLNAKNKELESLNEELTTFAFVASHDMGEPLRKVQIFSDRILKTEIERLSEAGKDSFKRILGAVKRMGDLLNDVLSFSKISSDKEAPKKYELNEILQTTKKENLETISKKGAVIESDYLPAIKCNRSHIALLFQNIISNALKYQHPSNKPVLKIKYELFGAGKINHSHAIPGKAYHRVSFIDNGIGFEIEYAEKIFQMFQRLHSMTEYPGTGIGLAICKKIIEAHKGFITAESTPGEGATFHCFFPVDEE